MKKLIIPILVFALSFSAYTQPVDDQAIIPVSISLNSILRLTVASGGNIEFVFSTLNQYTTGIVNSDRYDTNFKIASSVDFNVALWCETATLLGTDNPTRTLDLNYLEYTVTSTGGGGSDFTGGNGVLVQGPINIVEATGANAGDIIKNDFTINWAAGVTNNLLAGSPIADRYTTNVFLILSAD